MASQFLLILQTDDSTNVLKELALQMGFVDPDIVKGSPLDAARFLKEAKFSPSFVVIDIGARGADILPEIDELAKYCDANTRVVLIGNINDLGFYRQIIQRGITEYFAKPVQVADLKEAFFRGNKVVATTTNDANGKVISFMPAASGDGATTVATNVAYCLANEMNNQTVIVDMDYQYGLVARNLDLAPSSGIKELYEHPEGAIDLTLVEKTITPYKKNMFVIAAPKLLYFFPEISATTIGNLIYVLRKRFKYVVIDLPHTWTPWFHSVLRESDFSVMVAQLNIKSVTHATRLLDVMTMNSIMPNKVSLLINRSGSKLKEPITAADFAMACKKKVSFYIGNDSRTIATSENQGICTPELGSSVIARQFSEVAQSLTQLNSYTGI